MTLFLRVRLHFKWTSKIIQLEGWFPIGEITIMNTRDIKQRKSVFCGESNNLGGLKKILLKSIIKL